MTLYEINAQIFDLIDPETGELKDYEAFAQLQMDREQKIENTALFIKNLEAEAKAIKEEETALKARREPLENKAKRLRKYLEDALCGEEFKTARCSISYRKSKALEVEDTSALAQWLEENGFHDLVVYSAPTVSKTEVTKLLKSGTEIPGAVLAERSNLQIK